jgi:hypothetical protein
MKGRPAPNARWKAILVFDCTAVCPYDIVPGVGSAHAGEGRKDLSRIGSLLHYWFLNAKRLFHMLIALAFMFLTLMGVSVTYSEWEGYRKTPEEGLVHFTMFGGFTVFLAILCLYSFAKARSVR